MSGPICETLVWVHNPNKQKYAVFGYHYLHYQNHCITLSGKLQRAIACVKFLFTFALIPSIEYLLFDRAVFGFSVTTKISGELAKLDSDFADFSVLVF